METRAPWKVGMHLATGTLGSLFSDVAAPNDGILVPGWDSIPEALLAIPLLITAASLLNFIGIASCAKLVNKRESNGRQTAPLLRSSSFADWLVERGGPAIFTCNVTRTSSCLVLFALSAVIAARQRPHAPGLQDIFSTLALVGMPIAYLYASVLAILVTLLRVRQSVVIARHLNAVLLSSWAVYVYRDIWPLATVTLQPLDASEGSLFWVRFALLTIAGAVIPLVVPHPYIPLDPANPWPHPPAEQTASWLSFIFWFFVGDTIRDAAHVEHLSLDMLPPIADFDDAENLMRQSLHELDPLETKTRRHLAFRLWRVWYLEIIQMAFPLAACTLLKFVAPLSIRYLLDYVDAGGRAAFVRPWFWIAALLCGPILSDVCHQGYTYLVNRLATHAEAVITQLIFNHALRIRMKAEVLDAPSTKDGVSSSEAQSGKLKNLTGRVNNLVTSDLASIRVGWDFLYLVVKAPLEFSCCIWFLYAILGWSALVGLATIVILLPAPGKTSSLIHDAEVERMKRTDARVQTIAEAMHVVRMIKFFAWEKRIESQLAEKRNEELACIKRSKLLTIVNVNINDLIPLVTMAVTYATYTLAMKRPLTASIVFSSIAVFDTFTALMHIMMSLIPGYISAKVSLDRMNDFLHNTELLDDPTEGSDRDLSDIHTVDGGEEIGIRHAAFTWSRDNPLEAPTTGVGQRNFVLHVDEEVLFKRGRINLVVGPTGSGKTSLLMALLGEMHYIPSASDSFCKLPRVGGVAYAAQESWVQNETIRDNILFGAVYDERRYQLVLEQCALKRDLELFAAGDLTEVGEKGITLSGGQKARITLARAVYSQAQVILLDDVLAALDVHTSRWIVDTCFKGELLSGRTVILVTHNIALAGPIAEYVVAVSLDGHVCGEDSVASALRHDSKLAAEVAREQEAVSSTDKKVPTINEAVEKGDGKLIVEEEIELGHVGWPAMKLYFRVLGGGRQSLFWLSFMGSLVTFNILNNLQTWFLGYWARQYGGRDAAEVHVQYYLSGYCAIMIASVGFDVVALTVFVLGTLRASRLMHLQLITSVFSTTLRWLDKTPASRVITRCTQDIKAVDDHVGRIMGVVIEMATAMLLKLAAVMLYSPIFVLPGVIMAVVGSWVGQVYLKAQLSVKREQSNARAPVLGHFGAAFSGIISIRAYGAQDMFKRESYARINRYTRVVRAFWNLNRWVGIRMNALAALFTAALAAYLVYGRSNNASNVGFSLVMAVGFSSQTLWIIRAFNRLEVAANSLERIKQYLDVEHERAPMASGIPPAYWPASGDLRVENLSARYSENGPRVLHEISFEAKSGERIGIVGRTGSGKSSLALALLRCIYTEGQVFYDGLPTYNINLDALRSSITIIPQSPDLLSGTLRQNLDPFQQYDDAILNSALESAGLFSLQTGAAEGKVNLDTSIAGGGSNLSVGQRQIVALARAIVRQSKLLILDEATSAIDYATDTVIQSSLRKELDRGATVLTVAHRLQTIMDSDKIMVLDAGRIVEYGEPQELLENENGMFRALVDESPDRDALHGMVNRND